jgi:hypothetical protein
MLIHVPSLDPDSVRFMIYLVVYQINLLFEMIEHYASGFHLEVLDEHGKPTKDGEEPESQLIHSMFELFLYGSLGFAAIVTILVVLLCTSLCLRFSVFGGESARERN